MSLEVTYDELRVRIASFLGWNPDPEQWSDEDAASCERYLKSAIRLVLFGTITPGTMTVYQWSFLRKTYDFDTVSAQTTYTLPGDFGSPEGNLIFVDDGYSPVPFVNEAWIAEEQSKSPDMSGVTMYAATRHKRIGGVADQRQELVLFPKPTGAWTLRLTYSVTGDPLSADSPYPPGGAAHSRTYEAACVYEAARQTRDPEFLACEKDFKEALIASISADSRTRSAILGYNSDGKQEPRFFNSEFTVTYDGVLYEG